jgi:hypothetical protein
MSVSFDKQHNRAHLATLSNEALAARLDLLTALLEDLRTFPSICSLEKDLRQWISAHHVLCLERDLPLDKLQTSATYLFLRHIAFRTPFAASVQVD